jgi:hypothetical protein
MFSISVTVDKFRKNPRNILTEFRGSQSYAVFRRVYFFNEVIIDSNRDFINSSYPRKQQID